MIGIRRHAIWVVLLCALLCGCGVGTATTVTAASIVGPGRASTMPLVALPTVTPVPTATTTPMPAPATLPAGPPPTLAATSAYLFDPQTGSVYLARNADAELPMASTTKIMTALVALTYGSPDQRITIGPDATALENGQDSVMGLHQGDVLTLRDLLYGLLLPSGDDAAVAIAEGVAGSQQRFVALMNVEAFLLGMTHTHYDNVHGLDAPGHFTSTHDLALLAWYTLQHQPTFAQIVGTAAITIPATSAHAAYPLLTTNELLPGEPYAFPGTLGVKTGYTGNAGDCLVFYAVKGGQPLIGVLLGEPSNARRFDDATALLNWAFGVRPAA